MRRWLSLLIALLVTMPAHAAVRASLDAQEVAVGEPVTLTLSFEGQTREQPNLAPLQREFDILSTSRSNSMQIVNGSVSSRTEVHVVLSAKRVGQISVPQLSWAGESSNALTLTVSAAGAAGTAQGPDVFLETLVEPHDPYVQAAVYVTVRIYAGEHLLQGALEFNGSGDVLVQQLGKDRNRQLEKNGRQYEVIERRYALFPQKSGEIRLPGAQFSGQIMVHVRPDRLTSDPFSDLFANMGALSGIPRPIRLHGDDVVLKVQPRPAGIDEHIWTPARAVTLSEKWHPDNLEVHVGDPITRDLHLHVEGQPSAQLPDLAALQAQSLPPGLKSYPDEPKQEAPATSDNIASDRNQSIALIADQEGRYELPPLHLAWWDTNSKTAREVTLPGRTLTVLPALATRASVAPAGGTTSEPAAAAPAPTITVASGPVKAVRTIAWRDPWAWASGVFALLWLGTMAAWFWSRRASKGASSGRRVRAAAPLTAAQARAAFHAACRRNDAQQARHMLLAWAAIVWPDEPPAGLEALATRLGDEPTAALLVELDRALYGGGAWAGAALATAIVTLQPRGTSAHADGTHGGLAPLYH